MKFMLSQNSLVILTGIKLFPEYLKMAAISRDDGMTTKLPAVQWGWIMSLLLSWSVNDTDLLPW